MYKVSIYNSNVETVIHYPSADDEDPHLNKLQLSEGLSTVDSLSFPIYPNNPGYDKLLELTTKVKVIDTQDNSTRFVGRLLDASEKMESSSGLISKEVIMESALSFLNDTKLRDNTFLTDNVISFITQLLDIHNSKVDAGRKIFVGNIEVTAITVAHTCEFKTTLAELLAVREDIGGQIRVRETNGLLYLDWLNNISGNTVEVRLGSNMKDMVLKRDVTSLGTRIIPLGANNLTIASINNGVDYIEDTASKNVYSVIEKTVEYKDITDPYVLMGTCLLDIQKHTQPLYILTSNALDLSYLTGIRTDRFKIGTRLHIINEVMAVNDLYDVVQMELDLLTPYNPNLTIANCPVTMTNTISDLRATTIQNDGVYNNVQIGKSFGIRVVRSDNNVVTTMNATEGISIQNTNKKVFYVDLDGNIVCNDITANNMKAEGGTFNDIKANRGTFEDIKVTRGKFTDINAKGGTFDQIKATGGLTVEDTDSVCSINASGISLTMGDKTITIKASSNSAGNASALVVDDDMKIAKTIEVTGRARLAGGSYVSNGLIVYGDVDFQDNLEVFGTTHLFDLNIGDYTLKEYIEKVVAGTI